MYVPLTDEQLIQVRDTLYRNLQVWDEQYVEVDVLMSEIAYWMAEVAKARVSSYVAHGDIGAARYDLRIVRAELAEWKAAVEVEHEALSAYFAACKDERDGDLITPWLNVEEAHAALERLVVGESDG